MMNMKDTCAIVGIGETKFGTLPGVSDAALAIEATKKAIEDAGLSHKDVDGLLSQQPYHDTVMWYSLGLGEKMGFKLKYTTDLDIGGATPVGLVQHAVMAINAGLANVVVCVYGESSRSGRGPGPGAGQARGGRGSGVSGPWGHAAGRPGRA